VGLRGLCALTDDGGFWVGADGENARAVGCWIVGLEPAQGCLCALASLGHAEPASRAGSDTADYWGPPLNPAVICSLERTLISGFGRESWIVPLTLIFFPRSDFKSSRARSVPGGIQAVRHWFG